MAEEVVNTPPPANSADSPLHRDRNPQCNHAYTREPGVFGGYSGWMICLRCHNRIKATPRETCHAPPPRQSARTGY